MARIVIVVVLAGLGLLAPAASARPLDVPVAHAAATCADYPDQAAAQRAADTRDGDGDGIYCEDLPCPCLKPGSSDDEAEPPASEPSCVKPKGLQAISFSATKYPAIRRHTR